MPYRQDLTRCFAGAIGGSGLDEAAFRKTLGEAEAAVGWVADTMRGHALPLFDLPFQRDDLKLLNDIAAYWREDFTDILILGTGGSALGAKTLQAIADGDGPQIHFGDNLDGRSFAWIVDALDLETTGILTVSKSGSTPETLSQTLVVLGALVEALGEDAPAKHVLAIAEPGDSPLRRLAARWQLQILDHDPNLGGRYSVLSLVGLLPALIAGLDAAQVREGAAFVLDGVMENGISAAPVEGAALSVALARRGDIAQSVLLPYDDRLFEFTYWYRQLWAESIGKQGFGTTPVNALGPVDQHSQLQLWLDGPADKLFTVVTCGDWGSGPMIDLGLAGNDPALAYLEGRGIGDLARAEARATVRTLARHGRPVREITVDVLDEQAFGALFMHYMLETIVAARLWGVDAFDQPAVEEGKILAKKFLTGEEAGA
ncbi:hypothetical protein [Oceanibacterium hippocampi]|uniref:Glucose-6-phosphate isomerase n=1 Tax=Oceanibacterium hippocampi TaxID=745714 RepID=A0A1Y5S6Y1_9PROT|nr:hypothetical protein [Oceanibacterium hippocampi]SLN32933.1 Glucose-6-phosphate isomerase [Oceanibacterium hippocampi]